MQGQERMSQFSKIQNLILARHKVMGFIKGKSRNMG